MNSIERFLVRALVESTLYVLASPLLLLRWLLRRRAAERALAAVRRGSITCNTCLTETSLNRIARCSACGATEAGSLVYCSHCRTTFDTVTCEACHSTLRVFEEGR